MMINSVLYWFLTIGMCCVIILCVIGLIISYGLSNDIIIDLSFVSSLYVVSEVLGITVSLIGYITFFISISCVTWNVLTMLSDYFTGV